MKKTLLAIALLGAYAGAQAQTNVTIYGSFDGGIRYQNHQDAAGHSRITMGSNGTYNSNRLGFKGIEDLGGGLNAHFTLEAGFNNGSGALNNTNNQLFERSAFIGLGSQWGSLDLGRQYTVAYKTVGPYDPFDFKYPSIIPTSQASVSAGQRVNNDIQYTGSFGPITARAEWALGEQAGSARDNSQQALGVTWAGGPFSVGGAYTLRKPALIPATAATPPTNFQDNRSWTLGGSYTIAGVKIAIGYARETQDRATGNSTDQKNAWGGASYNFNSALGVAAGYYQTQVDNVLTTNSSGKRQLFIVGSTYKLSKRTNFYADLDYARYTDALRATLPVAATSGGQLAGLGGGTSQLPLATTNGQGNQLGFSVGINHVF
ncbi:porin [Noviherbaspirillum pedocola]|uniref:Porin n=1 Tax=Noviherbaspirillum pedocola TaxID=2801341 RepID=A0A934T2N2_9BURK|nr:porin [Noviherbaspirillum pedocola]MBK4738452.1 porin [Noviherbaspirillum pedocola]